MKKFLKGTLTVAVAVMCMLALFTFAASATTGATPAEVAATIADGATTYDSNGHYASYTKDGTTYYYTAVNKAIDAAFAAGVTEVTVEQNAIVGATITVDGKTLTIKGRNENVTITGEANDYMFATKGGAKLSFANIKVNVEKNGKFVNISGANGEFVLKNKAVVTVKPSEKVAHAIYVSADFTGGLVSMESGSVLTVTGYSTSVKGARLINITASTGALKLYGTIDIPDGLGENMSSFIRIGAAVPTIEIGGTINCLATCGLRPVMMYISTGTHTVTFNGKINYRVENYTGAFQLIEEDASSKNTFIIDGAEFNVYFDGSPSRHSCLFYMTSKSSKIEMKSGTINASAPAGKGFAIISGTGTPQVTVRGNSTIKNDGPDVATSVIQCVGSISIVTENGKTPVITSASGVFFDEKVSVSIGSDAAAKVLGYKYRVGDKEGSTALYFASSEAILAAIEKNYAELYGKKIYNIEGNTPVEVSLSDLNLSNDPALGLALKVNTSTASKDVTVGGGYVFVYPDDAYQSNKAAEKETVGSHDIIGAIKLSKLMNTKFGFNTTYLKASSANGAPNRIYVGIVNEEARAKAIEIKLTMNEAAIAVDANGTVYILAWNEAALQVAIDAFESLIEFASGSLKLPASFSEKIVVDADWIVDFNKPEGTQLEGQYVNDNSVQYVFGGYATTADGIRAYNDYVASLEKGGYTVVWSNRIGNNCFALYTNATKGHSLYVAYNDFTFVGADLLDKYDDLAGNDYQKCIRVTSMPTEDVKVPDMTAEPMKQVDSYVKVTDTRMAVVTLASGDIGMAYIYMLEDGRFVVIDGGSTGADKAYKALYDTMAKMYKEAYGHAHDDGENKLHIAAWYMTHPHSDHVYAFRKFLRIYGAEVKMDYMIGSLFATNSIMTNPVREFTEANLAEMQGHVEGGFEYIRVQTGQVLYLANLKIEVLMTYEDHAPFNVTTTNETNTITKFYIGASSAAAGATVNTADGYASTTTMMILGDAWRHSGRHLSVMYGSYLKSDIVEAAHHGNTGVEAHIYELIAADYAIVNNLGKVFEKYLNRDTYPDLYQHQIDANNKMIDIAKYTWTTDRTMYFAFTATEGVMRTDSFLTKNYSADKAHEHDAVITAHGEYHYGECSVCGAIIGLAEHSYDSFADATADKHSTACVCGVKTEPVAHSFGELVNTDANEHWKECACGAKSELGAHSFGELVSTDADKHWKECVCGAKTDEAAHEYTAKSDADNHWEECACSKTTAKEAHSFDKDGKCAKCGYTEPKKPGCKGTVSGTAVALIVSLGVCAVFAEKKRR